MSSIIIKHNEKRKNEIDKIIRRRMLYAAGFGLIPLPVVDAAVILGIQVLMVKDIAARYEVAFMPHVVKTLIASLAGGLGTLGAIKLIPGIGSVMGGATVSASAAATTYAIGKVFAMHFEHGGTLLDFNPEATRKYFEELFREGQLKAEQLENDRKSKSEKLLSTVQNSIPGVGNKNIAAKEQADPVIAMNLQRREKLLEVRRKSLRNKNRKANLIKWMKRLVMLLLLISVVVLFTLNSGQNGSSASKSELDLYMEETMAKNVKLSPVAEIDSLAQERINNFKLNSTEHVISRYISSELSTYPKRFALSAVRFTNNSVSLNSGAKEQLINIALLMKQYPDLIVNLYGHSSSVGPKFSRQKIGRKRARLLKSIFLQEGIPAYRLTGNYIEKASEVHDEYWGAEIVIDVLSEERAVSVQLPDLMKPAGKARDLLGWAKGKANAVFKKKKSVVAPEETAPVMDTAESFASLKDSKNVVVLATTIMENPDGIIDSNALLSPDTDTAANDSNPEVDMENDSVTVETENEELENTEEVEKEKKEEKAPETESLFKDGTTESVIENYLKLPSAVFPKAFGLSQVYFEKESTKLGADAKEQIANLATVLEGNPEIRINIYALIPAGNTEEMSTEELVAFQSKWKGIGKKRAQIVKKNLQKLGIPNRRVKARVRLTRANENTRLWRMEIELKK